MFILNQMKKHGDLDALIWCDKKYSYANLYNRIGVVEQLIDNHQIKEGSVVSLEADFSPNALIMLLSLIQKKAIIVPLSSSIHDKSEEFRKISQVEKRIIINGEDHISVIDTNVQPKHELIDKLRDNNIPGLILFSSGSSGKSKAVVHDIDKLMKKYEDSKKQKITITFLLFDHIGGFDTIFYTLAGGGCIVTLSDRSPKTVCKIVEKYQVQVLPVSPTFLNLLLVSGEYAHYDLSSLEYITYGAELMNQFVLQKIYELLPNVRMRQKYGLSELGVLNTKSESSDSLWMKLDSDKFKIRIRDNMLEVKTESTMLGYLNEKSPFSKDGWFKTGDVVEQKGEYVRVLGRESEIINVGGRKVYPAEIENILKCLDNIKDIIIKGEENMLVGQVVTAKVVLIEKEDLSVLKRRIRFFLKGKVENYKIPQKIDIVDISDMYSARLKKIRK